MIHPLPSLDKDKVLPKEKELHKFRDEWEKGYDDGYNTCKHEVDSLGVEMNIEELSKAIDDYSTNRKANPGGDCFRNELAHAIATNKSVMRIVRVKK